MSLPGSELSGCVSPRAARSGLPLTDCRVHVSREAAVAAMVKEAPLDFDLDILLEHAE